MDKYLKTAHEMQQLQDENDLQMLKLIAECGQSLRTNEKILWASIGGMIMVCGLALIKLLS